MLRTLLLLCALGALPWLLPARAGAGAFPYRGIALYPQDHAHLPEVIELCRKYDLSAVQLIQEGSENAITSEPEAVAAWRSVVRQLRQADLAVHLWVHEFNDVPAELLRDGYLELDTPAVERHLQEKYRRLFELQPELSGLVLTLYETPFVIFGNRVESVRDHPARIAWMIRAMARICKAHDRALIVRTFCYRAEEYEWFISAINQVWDEPFVVMSKVAPWDFWPEYPDNPVFGRIGDRAFIQEHDLAGEYLGQSQIPCALPARIKAWMEHGARGAMTGAVGRISRYSNPILGTPNEVNLAAFAAFLARPETTPEAVWKTWIAERYGPGAAGLERSLARSYEAVVGAMYARGFYFLQNHSAVPSLGYMDRVSHYSPAHFDPARKPDEMALRYPDEQVYRDLLAEKEGAIRAAQESRRGLEAYREALAPEDYAQLAGQLDRLVWTARAWREIADAYFSYRLLLIHHDAAHKARLDAAVERLDAVAEAVEASLGARAYPPNPRRLRELAGQIKNVGNRINQQNLPWLRQQRALAAEMKRDYPATRSMADWQEHRGQIRAAVLRGLYPEGRLPERTPLNARVTRTLPGSGYRVENVIFESRPGFFVVGNLYLPEGAGPFPAMVNPIGHWGLGKVVEQVQSRCIGLARRGVAAFAIETVGAMERAAPGNHHDVGLASVLVGQTDVGVQVWDAMRAVDYLQSRPEIDSNRIGSTGVSGGGLITLYLSALDERIVCAVPVCYVVTYDSLWSTGIWHCVCSHFPGLLTRADMGQVAALVAPRPQLLMHGTQDDMFVTWGSRLAYQETREIYALYRAEERVRLFESDCPHDYNQEMREVMYGFVARWLQGQASEAPQAEAPYALRDSTALFCGIPPESLTLRDLAQAEADRFALPMPAKREDWLRRRARITTRLRELILPEPFDMKRVELEFEETDNGAGDAIRATVRVREAGRLPFTLWKFTPRGKPGVLTDSGAAVLWLPGRPGRELERDPLLARMLAEGTTVLTLPEHAENWALPEGFAYVCATNRYLFGPGYSTPAECVRQVLLGLEIAEREWGIARVSARGAGSAGHVLLLSAALSTRLEDLEVETPMTSYRELLTDNWRANFYDVVPWLLETADLPQIAGTLAPRRLRWRLNDAAAAEATVRAYQLSGAPSALTLEPSGAASAAR